MTLYETNNEAVIRTAKHFESKKPVRSVVRNDWIMGEGWRICEEKKRDAEDEEEKGCKEWEDEGVSSMEKVI